MDWLNLLLFLISAASLLLALFVYFQGPKRQTYQSFAATIFVGAIWIFSIAMFRQSDTYQEAFLWDWIVYLSGALSAPVMLWFSMVFPFKQEGLPFKTIILIFLPTILLVPVIGTPLFIKNINIDTHHVTLGPLYFLWGTSFFVIFGAAFLKLLKNYRRSAGFQKLQLRYILLSLILPGLTAGPFNIVLPYFGNYQLIWIGPICLSAMMVIISYAIIRYRLMDLRIIARDTITKILTVVALSSICALAAWLYGVISGYPVHKEVAFPIVGAMTLIVFTFNYFFNKMTIFTRRYIIKGSYDPELLLKHLTNTLASTIGFEKTLNSILKHLVEGLNIKHASIILINHDRANRQDRTETISFGEKTKPWNNLKKLIKYFQKNRGLIFKEEFEKQSARKKNAGYQLIINEMAEKNVALILPLAAKKELSGFLLLGEKPASDAYTTNDLNMLETFASQASFAIENARLFTEIQNFNEILKEEIKNATLELKEQNRFLAALRRLDLIIMETLELKKLCQKFVDALSSELKCQFGLIGLIDENKHGFYFQAVTQKSKLDQLLTKRRVKAEDIQFPLDKEINSVVKVINSKQELTTNNLGDVLFPAFTKKRSKNWQKELKIKTLWLYPVKSKTRVLGVLIFGWEKIEREISAKERDLMQSVIDQTGIALDNTLLYEKLKESIAQLKRANVRLRELDRMKGEFVSIASHELRTPMTSVNNYLWMVLNGKAGKITDKQHFYLDRAAISTKRLIHLVEDMLTISRIEGGKIHVEPRPGNIVILAKTVFNEMEEKAKAKKIKLTFQPPKKELPLVLMDKEKIQEVLINLIDNAIKFTNESGKVTVSFRKKGKYVSTLITDTGRGISKNDIPKLFKKFGRLDRSFATVAQTSGTGLGLFICKQIVDLHHGKISVKSEQGKGSTFHFNLKVSDKEVKTAE